MGVGGGATVRRSGVMDGNCKGWMSEMEDRKVKVCMSILIYVGS